LFSLQTVGPMNLGSRNLWQVAAGLKERNYVDTLLKWDVVIIGPGNYGKWPACKDEMKQKAPGQVSISKRFCEEMKRGDLIALRLGTDEVHAVGEVADESAQWLDDFGDVDGWDLQTVRRVRWLHKGFHRFPAQTLKFGPTILALNSPAVVDWMKTLEIPSADWDRELKLLPATCVDGERRRLLSHADIGEHLYDRGISSDAVRNLLSSIDELTRIARWYQRAEAAVSENETIAYLSIPLLQCLGWSPQKMAIEWGTVDIALFEKLPRTDENLAVVIEAKKLDEPIKVAFEQAAGYAGQAGRERCRRIVLTDGIKYYVYVRGEGEKFSNHPKAYLNLTRLVADYPTLGFAGAKDALTILASAWSEYEGRQIERVPESQ